MSTETLARLVKSYGFGSVNQAAKLVGTTAPTMRIWHKDPYMRENVLISALKRESELLQHKARIS